MLNMMSLKPSTPRDGQRTGQPWAMGEPGKGGGGAQNQDQDGYVECQEREQRLWGVVVPAKKLGPPVAATAVVGGMVARGRRAGSGEVGVMLGRPFSGVVWTDGSGESIIMYGVEGIHEFNKQQLDTPPHTPRHPHISNYSK